MSCVKHLRVGCEECAEARYEAEERAAPMVENTKALNRIAGLLERSLKQLERIEYHVRTKP